MAIALPSLLAVLGLLAPIQEAESFGLSAALDLLREGSPGDPGFEAVAAKQLPLLIASSNDGFVAGSAYLAGKHGRVACVPALLRALQRENERGIDKSDTSKRAILDALIVLDAQVQPGLLMQRLERTSLTETCLLLLQYKAGASDALLELFDKAPSHTKAPWAAACALVSNRDKRIAERLIAGRAWELDLKVSGLGRGGGWAYCGGDPRWHSSHEIWPPKVTYDLRLPEYGAALLLIRSVRTEGTRSGLVEQGIAERERNALRIRLLNVLLGEEQERGLLRPSEDFALDVTSVEDYHRKLQDHCMDLRDRLTHVALRLEALGHLEHAQELADLIVLHIRLHDFFSEDGARLPRPPDLPWVEFEEY